VIARAVLLQGLFFGGKEWTGDGAPEGLPLNVRFFCAGGLDMPPSWLLDQQRN
jgi:hypothetical protein